MLDAVNLRLLAELGDNPRLSMSELGRRVSMSAPAVTERVQRLEQAGIIKGYRIELDPAALGLPVAGLAELEEVLDRFALFGQTTTSIIVSTPVEQRQPPLA
jgi:Lrp/AsnC family leucine-responsive transcriptional regulator